MARGDLRVVGPQASFGRYIASGGTAVVAGEPLHTLGTATSGEVDVNEYVLVAVDSGIIGTHSFGGVALKDSENAAAGTTNAQFLNCAIPVPSIGRVRGKALTATEVDTLTELYGLIGDHTLIDYNATGAADGGEEYTFVSNPTANTSAFTIVGGNVALQELECVIDDRGYRAVVA